MFLILLFIYFLQRLWLRLLSTPGSWRHLTRDAAGGWRCAGPPASRKWSATAREEEQEEEGEEEKEGPKEEAEEETEKERKRQHGSQIWACERSGRHFADAPLLPRCPGGSLRRGGRRGAAAGRRRERGGSVRLPRLVRTQAERTDVKGARGGKTLADGEPPPRPHHVLIRRFITWR